MGWASVPLSFFAEIRNWGGGGVGHGKVRLGCGGDLTASGFQAFSWPFYPAPLVRCMAFLLQRFHKESIEKIKNTASGEFKIKFLQNTKWKRELKNRNREPHDLHKSSI